MTQEQIKAKAKGQFPNDEFKQQAVIDAINWATKELEKENAELKEALKGKVCKCMTYLNFKDLEKECDKAKEIIKTFCGFCSVFNSTNGSFDNLIAEAEQFLKDNGCPDCFCEDCTKDCDIDNAIQQANKGLDFDKIADEMEQDLKDSEVEK